jgi:hypothetical protein
MKTNVKPANSKARALLEKLLALAERGIDGEKASAQRKIRRLKARFDFSAPEPAETPDLFSGRFTPSATARPIFAFGPNEFEVANAVKWARKWLYASVWPRKSIRMSSFQQALFAILPESCVKPN